jgi:hypothetical protein
MPPGAPVHPRLALKLAEPLPQPLTDARLYLDEPLDLVRRELVRRRRHECALVADALLDLGNLTQLGKLREHRARLTIRVVRNAGHDNTGKHEDDQAADGQLLHAASITFCVWESVSAALASR